MLSTPGITFQNEDLGVLQAWTALSVLRTRQKNRQHKQVEDETRLQVITVNYVHKLVCQTDLIHHSNRSCHLSLETASSIIPDQSENQIFFINKSDAGRGGVFTPQSHPLVTPPIKIPNHETYKLLRMSFRHRLWEPLSIHRGAEGNGRHWPTGTSLIIMFYEWAPPLSSSRTHAPVSDMRRPPSCINQDLGGHQSEPMLYKARMSYRHYAWSTMPATSTASVSEKLPMFTALKCRLQSVTYRIWSYESLI